MKNDTPETIRAQLRQHLRSSYAWELRIGITSDEDIEDAVSLAVKVWERNTEATPKYRYCHAKTTANRELWRLMRRSADERLKTNRYAQEALRPTTDDTITDRLALALAFAQLDEVDQAILWLQYVERLSIEEITAALGISRTVLFERKKKALKKLRGMLGDEGAF